MMRVCKFVAWLVGGWIVLVMLSPVKSAQPLTDGERERVRLTLDRETYIHPEFVDARPVLPEMKNLEVRDDGFVVADFEIPADMIDSAQALGEARLIMIREALWPYGYRDYRVNINGPPPGSALVTRYGSARLTHVGALEWLTD